MPGKPPLLSFAIGVITEASLLLQILNECPQLPSTYLGDIGTQTVTVEKIIEVSYAICDNSYCIFAFPFGLGAKRVT
jgi:hypothetical protein